MLRIFGPKRGEVTEGWRKLHNEELHHLYYLQSIIRMIKSRRMRLARHVARMRVKRGYWCENRKERDHQEDQDVGGRIIIKWILER
jgi:hypothetical protein